MLKSNFSEKVTFNSKPGGYTLCHTTDCAGREVKSTDARLLRLPLGDGGTKRLIFGVFVNAARIVTGAQGQTEIHRGRAVAQSELFREEIKKALRTFL